MQLEVIGENLCFLETVFGFLFRISCLIWGLLTCYCLNWLIILNSVYLQGVFSSVYFFLNFHMRILVAHLDVFYFQHILCIW